MALYEVVLRHEDRREEIRFTDHRPRIGTSYLIDGRTWQVERADASRNDLARTRFICATRDPGAAR